MKKNKVIQFSLVALALILFFFTYKAQENTNIVNIDDEASNKKGKDLRGITNIIENANYNGTDNRGTFFKLNADIAEVFEDKPNLSNMKVVNAVISLNDGKKIYINSDFCIYDRVTNDAKFTGNVVVTESNNKITSDNLDLNLSKNLITVYNRVKYNGEKTFLIADKVDINILTNESEIFMFDKKNKVKVKYKN